nr:transposase [Flavobacterium sp.]
KSNNKFNRFTFKGLDKVEMEFLLMAIGHNFRKMVANNNKKHKTHIKFSVRVRNRLTEVEIYLLKPLQNIFS